VTSLRRFWLKQGRPEIDPPISSAAKTASIRIKSLILFGQCY
jgi:hypothetical protein